MKRILFFLFPKMAKIVKMKDLILLCCVASLLCLVARVQYCNTNSAMFQEIRNSTTGAINKAKLVFNKDAESTEDVESQEPQQPDRLEELAEYCPQLTFQQRLIGFAVSFSLGCKF